MAKIIPIYKSEDRKKCENYRPISILPVISKVFESEIFSQLYEHLSDRQCGFRPKYGTNAALLEMCDLWLSHIDKGELNGVVILDIRKAFDSIKHKILFKKLKNQFGICDNELNWFSSYLNDRMQVCYVNGQTSAPKIIVNGIPQGSILGPLLFLLYINDLPDNLEKSIPFLYADDAQIFSFFDNFDTLVMPAHLLHYSIKKYSFKFNLLYIQ